MELLQLFLPNSISLIGKSCARLDYDSPAAATSVLHKLHQMDIMGQKLVVKYAAKDARPVREPVEFPQQIHQPFLSKLLAVNSQLDFSNPPPPGLKYKYPKATAAIVRRIGNCLRENQSFYTQVLHLMNRMGLPPPFTPAEHRNLTKDAGCQTESCGVRKADLATDESELESDEGERLAGKRKRVPRCCETSKRIKAILAKEKETRRTLGEKTIQLSEDVPLPESVFENRGRIVKNEIRISAPENLPIEMDSEEKEDTKPVTDDSTRTEPGGLTNEDLQSNRIPLDQLKGNPIFQNYDPGIPSNVLYIKNLAKNVTAEDLQGIFLRYGRTPDSIAIDLKTTGRLRGQAFITFANPYEGEDSEVPIGQRLIDRALQDTNGFILKNKPMYVCYAKSSSVARKSQ